jgi:hypothetical protein
MTKDSYLQRKRRHAKANGRHFDLASSEIPDKPKQGDTDKYDPELKAEDVFRWELDRLDNDSSYIPGNVTWTSHNSNASKSKLTIEEMRELADRNIEDTEENAKLIRRQRICRNVLKIYDAHQETRDCYWREKIQAAARNFIKTDERI